MRYASIFVCALVAASNSGWADDTVANSLADVVKQMEAMQQTVEDLKKTVHEQQGQIDSLKQENQQLKTQTTQPAPPPPPPAPAPTAKVTQSTVPEIGVVVDVLGSLTESKGDDEGNDRLSIRELELVFGHDVDPFTRFDTTITFSDLEDPDIEEAYLTYSGLPYDVIAKIGRMRQKIGKESAIHRDQLDTVDDPLVIQEYFGGEGLFKTGLELSKYLPQIWPSVTHELTLGIMEGGVGEGGKMFESPRRVPSYYAHLKNFWDISDTTNLELGATYLTGSSDEDSRYEVNALGLDLTLTHFVTPINKLKWQSELFYQDRKESTVFNKDIAQAYINRLTNRSIQWGSLIANSFGGNIPIAGLSPLEFTDIGNGLIVSHFEQHPWGMYSLLDYRLTPRFGIGGRFDYVEPVDNFPLNPRQADRAYAAYLTYYQSEFARLRLQYEHLETVDGGDDNRLYLQGTYAIGIHKHALK